MTGIVHLTAERVVLRRPTEQDLDDLFAVFSDPETMRYWSWLPFRERAEAGRLLENIRALEAEGTLLQWAIADRETDRLLGTCTLASIDHDNGRAEVGFILGRDHQGRGLAREAVSALLDHAFGALGLRRIEADVDPRNEASIRLLSRLGFSREGFLRERWLVGGEVADSILFGLLGRDWDPGR